MWGRLEMMDKGTLTAKTDLVIVTLDRARVALLEAKTIQQTKKIVDMAASMEIFAKRQQLSEEAVRYATDVKVEALRQLGAMLKQTARAKGSAGTGRPNLGGTKREPPKNTEPTLAELGIDKKTSALAQKVADLNNDQVESLKQGVALNELKRAERKREQDAQRQAKIKTGEAAQKQTELYRLIHSRIEDLDIAPASIDAIITDPPYPAEFLPLYETLAEKAARWLKPGGSLIVMIGQSYLPAIVAMLSGHLTYQWTAAYLTPGGQSAQLWDRKVNTFWKPLLWYVKGEYGGKWIGDVLKSAVNQNDKRFHDWGQSESGMNEIVARFTEPGDLVLDPFCGAGTTGIAAVYQQRRFIGSDASAESIALAAARLEQTNVTESN